MGLGLKERIGVFGGTFDPIHTGHLIVANTGGGQLGLDNILFIPAGQPWLKTDRFLTPAHHRARMVELAIGDNPCFRYSEIEILRPGPTYTIDTVKQLHDEYPQGTELCLMLGIDALGDLDRWHQPRKLIKLAAIAGIGRPGSETLDRAVLERVKSGLANQIATISVPMIDISSTDIRSRVREGKSIKYLVPEPVEKYIKDHGLYLESAK